MQQNIGETSEYHRGSKGSSMVKNDVKAWGLSNQTITVQFYEIIGVKKKKNSLQFGKHTEDTSGRQLDKSEVK